MSRLIFITRLLRFDVHSLIVTFQMELFHCELPLNTGDGVSNLGHNQMSRDTTKPTKCSPSEDSDQPGHPPTVIRVFAVRMRKA